MRGNRRKVEGHLEDLLQVISTGDTLFGERTLHPLPIESHQVDQVRETGREPDQLEHVANLRARQPVDVIKDNYYRTINTLQLGFQLLLSVPNSLFRASQDI